MGAWESHLSMMGLWVKGRLGSLAEAALGGSHEPPNPRQGALPNTPQRHVCSCSARSCVDRRKEIITIIS